MSDCVPKRQIENRGYSQFRSRVARLLVGENLRARVLRGSSWTVIGYGVSQVLRLAANMILTRLLAPEVFGVMALVQVFLHGLEMFSDTGINSSIIQSKRGDDPEFLNTAWTIKVFRGAFLFLIAAMLAWPVALLYSAPELAVLIPAAGTTAFIAGFYPTKLDTGNRHMMLGRITIVELLCQVAGLLVTILLASILQSVWALVIGGILASLCHVWLSNVILPGPANRFYWDASAAKELFTFGRWIFLGSVAGFLISQGDRAFLGMYLSLSELGLYNIGFFLGSVPLALASSMSSKIVFPIYKHMHSSQPAETRSRIFWVRSGLSASFLTLAIGAACTGPFIVKLLYTEQYEVSGAIVSLVAIALIPKLVLSGCNYSVLAAGDSKRFTLVVVAMSACQTIAFAVCIPIFGVGGVALSFFVTPLVCYPLIAYVTQRYGGWLPLHDTVFFIVGISAACGVIWLHNETLQALVLGM